MKSPCEFIVWHVLPSIRSALAEDLSELGLSQREISKRLGMTEAAVSQYRRGKRGKGIEFKGKVRQAIRKLAEDIAGEEDFDDQIYRICRICAKIKAEKTLCLPHQKAGLVPEGCDACMRMGP
jgi:hypothetical protein